MRGREQKQERGSRLDSSGTSDSLSKKKLQQLCVQASTFPTAQTAFILFNSMKALPATVRYIN